MKLKLLFALLIVSITNAQTQIGQDIVGDMPDDKFGHGVALSADGNVLAVSAPNNDNNGTDAGHIRVYSKTSGTWTQIGQDIEGANPGDKIGYKIALSDDGSVLAFSALSAKRSTNNVNSRGLVSVYKNVNNIWTKIGQDIIDIEADIQFGLSISLSSDGSIIAIGSPSNVAFNFEQVQVYKNNAGLWQKIGGFSWQNNTNNDLLSTYFGWNVSLSADGTVIAFTDIEGGISGGTNNRGLLYVYKYQLGTWVKVGNTIYSKNQNDTFGHRVVLSANGSILAVTSQGNFTNGTLFGAVSVYKNIATNWVQIGADIVGEAASDNCGTGLAISANGNILAIGCIGCDTPNGTDTGKVRIFQNIQGNWVEQGNIIGQNAGDAIGFALTLSKDGHNLAIGNYGNSSVGAKPSKNIEEQLITGDLPIVNNYESKGGTAGSVQVYDISGILSSGTFVLENFNIYPNPTTEILSIELDNNLTLEKVLVYDTAGKLVKETTEKTINVSAFAKGIYNVQVVTNQGKATKKVVVK